MELAPDRSGASGRLRRYLAYLRSAEERSDPAGHETVRDVALAAAVTIALLITIIYTVKVPVSCTSDTPWLLGPGGVCMPTSETQGIGWHSALLTTAAAWPLALRRFRPLAALWLSLAGALVVAGRPTVIVVIPVAIAAYSAVVYSPFRRAAMLGVATAGVLATASFAGAPTHHMSYFIEHGAVLLAPIPLLIVGNAMRLSRRHAADSQAQMVRLEAEHAETTRAAIGRERARIAGELHDVVAHNVSMMVVQAGAARRILGSSPDEARTALLAVEDSGRAAIVELQHLLGLLAPPDRPQETTADPEALRPQPGLDQVRSLIDRVAAAGLPVQLGVCGAPRTLPPGMDLAAYRVIQEALTNVIKHAGQPLTTVTLDYRRSDLVIEVADDGRAGGSVAPEVGRPAGSRTGTMPGTGRGLLGMRERVAMYGGELDARPRPGGGWLVRATIPEPPLLPAATAYCEASP